MQALLRVQDPRLSESMSANLVIGADRIHSTIRQLARILVRKEHAGYIVRRGTISEKDVSSETADFFAAAGVAEMLWRSYMIW